MILEIITPEKNVYAGEATLVQLPGLDGSFEILTGHAPLIAALAGGKIKVQDPQKQLQFFEIKGGIVEVLHDRVLVLAE